MLIDPFRLRCSASTVLPSHAIVRCLRFDGHDGSHMVPAGTHPKSLHAWAWNAGERAARIKLERIQQWAPRKIGFHAPLPRPDHMGVSG